MLLCVEFCWVFEMTEGTFFISVSLVCVHLIFIAIVLSFPVSGLKIYLSLQPSHENNNVFSLQLCRNNVITNKMNNYFSWCSFRQNIFQFQWYDWNYIEITLPMAAFSCLPDNIKVFTRIHFVFYLFYDGWTLKISVAGIIFHCLGADIPKSWEECFPLFCAGQNMLRNLIIS